MKIFVTGATGFIGFAVSANLARAGHEVFGLCRDSKKGAKLEAAEITPVAGDMGDPGSYLERARACQILIHCAAEYSPRYMELDRRTVDALLGAAHAAASSRLFLYTSGCWVYGNTGNEPADEGSPLNPPGMVVPRIETERAVLAGNTGSVRTIVLRPGCVYGGAGSLTASWFESAEKEGKARIVGDGEFRWTMAHIADVAEAYRLAAESPFTREVFNVTDRSRFTVRECARAASLAATGHSGVVTTTPEEAMSTLGPMAECLMLDQHVDSSKASRLLGWHPRHGGFVDGVVRYYAAWKAAQA